jgi:aspartyl-tRNA(Asn)/glutamyl-tRNA(Gln) amidotransferase subunit A
VEILDLLARRALSARELVLDCVRRIEVGEDTIQAFVTRTPELALRAAGEADEARARGDSVGRLAGVPVAVKDVFLTRGVRTTAGSRVLAEYVPDEDAAVWQRLSAAGAGLLGKTTTHEFGYGTASPPTRNPWDIQRTPGGSSGGSAAALACRMAPVATGTVPAGFDDRGLPVGLSLAGLPEWEAEVVGLGVVIDEEVQLWRREPKIRP